MHPRNEANPIMLKIKNKVDVFCLNPYAIVKENKRKILQQVEDKEAEKFQKQKKTVDSLPHFKHTGLLYNSRLSVCLSVASGFLYHLQLQAKKFRLF